MVLVVVDDQIKALECSMEEKNDGLRWLGDCLCQKFCGDRGVLRWMWMGDFKLKPFYLNVFEVIIQGVA